MKKIFTLLVGACVAASAMAFPVKQVVRTNNDVLDPSLAAQKYFQGNMKAITANDAPDGMFRAMESGTGQSWVMMFRLLGGAAETFGLSQGENQPVMTINEFPFYVVLFATQNTQTGNDFLPSYVLWPTVSAYDNDVWNDGVFDEAKAKAKYGTLEAALAPEPINETINREGRIPVLAGFYGMTSILQSDVIGATITWNGREGYASKPCSVSNSGVSFDGSYVNWKAYDPDYNEAAIDFNWILGTSNGQGVVSGATVNAIYSLTGNPVVLGFTDLVLNFDEVHAFNCGLVDIDSEYGVAYFDEFEPVKRYYLAWVDETMSFMGQSNGQDVFAWMPTFNGKEVLEDGLLQNIEPIARSTNEYQFNFLKAALFVPANSNGFDGMYSMPEAKYTTKVVGGKEVIDEWKSVPTPYELVPGYLEAAACDQDGFYCCWNGYSVYPMENLALIGVGDENYGFNFKFSADGWNGHTIMGYSTQPLILHDDANNWNNMSQIPATSTSNYNVLDRAFGSASVEEVITNAPVVSTQYFNLQGQRLNAAPQKGIFIQREIKADGTVKTVKIAK